MVEPLGVVLTIASALVLSMRNVLVGLGLVQVPVLPGVFVVTSLSIPLSLGLAMLNGDFNGPLNLNLYSIGYLASGGILQFVGARTLVFSGMKLIGASRATTIAQFQVALAALFSILFLREIVSPLKGLGLSLVMLGIILISLSGVRKAASKPTKGFTKGLMHSFLASILFAVSYPLIRAGVVASGSPLVGNFVSSASGLGVVLLLMASQGQVSSLRSIRGSSLRWLVISSFLTALSLLLQFVALSIAQVVEVVPINSSHPVYTAIISYVFLRRAESMNWKVVAGAAILVSGVVAITM